VINLVITFSVPGISWQGHVGGLAVGAVLAAAYAYAPAARRRLFHIAAPLLMLALLGALVVLRTAELNPSL
jgi:membrane associated rhomboid family serine protease